MNAKPASEALGSIPLFVVYSFTDGVISNHTFLSEAIKGVASHVGDTGSRDTLILSKTAEGWVRT
jgi:hypothetical protein